MRLILPQFIKDEDAYLVSIWRNQDKLTLEQLVDKYASDEYKEWWKSFEEERKSTV